MATPPDISSLLPAISQKKDLLHKDFSDLESHKEAIALSSQGWTELEVQLIAIEDALRKRHEDVLQKEKDLEARMKESQEFLDNREVMIGSREQASLSRVQEQKEAAVVAIKEEKRKWNEERQRIEKSGCVPRIVRKKKDTSTKNAAVRSQKTTSKDATNVATLVTDEKGNGNRQNEDEKTSGVAVRPYLKTFCETMNGEALRKYVAEQKKDINAFRKELPYALKCAPDPCGLVLKALEGYHLIQTTIRADIFKKKDAGPSANRRGCILLLESLSELLADASDQKAIPSKAKEAAKGFADSWKSRLKSGGTEALRFLDAQSFLQLLATFELGAECDEAMLIELIISVARRKQTPPLCRVLGLSAKVPDIIERLIKDCKQLEAVAFIQEFGLSGRFPPVPLLKAYLKDPNNVPQSGPKGGSEDKSELIAKELAALKAVLKCIDEYKLKAEYPPEGLHKRVAQLERKKFEKKRGSDAIIVVGKKLHTNGAEDASPQGPPFRSLDRVQHGGNPQSYSQSYGSGYGGATGGSSSYASDGQVSVYGSMSYAYDNVQYGGSSPSGYQGSFRH